MEQQLVLPFDEPQQLLLPFDPPLDLLPRPEPKLSVKIVADTTYLNASLQRALQFIEMAVSAQAAAVSTPRHDS